MPGRRKHDLVFDVLGETSRRLDQLLAAVRKKCVRCMKGRRYIGDPKLVCTWCPLRPWAPKDDVKS